MPRIGGIDYPFRPPREPLVPPGGIDCHARDMTATLSADLSLAAAQEKLAELKQWLPIDGDPHASVGSLVENNSTGPLRLGYGAWRDLLLGAQFFNGEGRLITAGGRTVKNVAGYDLTKFMVGQRGIFGKLVTITTRTYRKPAGAVLARFAPSATRLGGLFPTTCRPQWGVLSADALLCGYLGDERAVAYYLTALREHRPLELAARSLQDDVAHRLQLWQARGEVIFRASVPPVKILNFAKAAALAGWVADAAFGVVIGGAAADRTEAIGQAAQAAGGSVFFERPDELTFLHATMNPVQRRLVEHLKRAFDPDGALKPLPWQAQ